MHTQPTTSREHAGQARPARNRMTAAIIGFIGLALLLAAWAWGIQWLDTRVASDLDRTLRDVTTSHEVTIAPAD